MLALPVESMKKLEGSLQWYREGIIFIYMKNVV
ncbi:hypothetical protein CACET_c28930 [Clostridium aceticum]|uniref:Uncharacterized protein n=1 Tax=Clostridium aceticum TaxID=84022 RepID=A0A0G3WDA5_9CLOT|nr:hypothetical protein CACET_c28930 [Clostridium aceticum]